MEIINARDWQRPGQSESNEIKSRVAIMLETIAGEGDVALERYSRKFDGFSPGPVTLQPWESYPLGKSTQKNLCLAADRIRSDNPDQ